ncbi:SurA N-terminal domain-containing protein [Peribacillus butanolivorans]|uniref:hypothetical protein n=1 Tax=Peribacillus butanolivorans TaxID=421767 RepID=UPI0036DB9E74
MKSIRNLIFLAITVTIISTSLFLFNSNSTRASDEKAVFNDLGKYIKSLKVDEKKKKLNKGILDKNQYLILINFYQNIDPKMSTEEAEVTALNQIVEEAAIKEKAKELNLFPSSDEVKARVKEERFKFENASEDDPDNKQVKEMLDSLIEGLGMTPDEYWNSYVPTGYEFTISQENLYEKETKAIKDEEQKTSKWNKKNENYIDNFKMKHKDEIYQLKNK